MCYLFKVNKLTTLINQGVMCLMALVLGASLSGGLAMAEEAPPPTAAKETANVALNEMDDLPLAQCLPQQRAIQTINQRPLALRWLFLPYRGQLEVKHRRCLKQQSLLDQAQLQALPGPVAASVKPRKPIKPAKESSLAQTAKAPWFKWWSFTQTPSPKQ
jgi:hypothetical protein